MTSERRRYFRLPDQALIRYSVIPEAALERERSALRAHEQRSANVETALLEIDVRLQGALAALRSVDREVAQALDLLNRKLTLLGRVVALEGSGPGPGDYREHVPAEVSLSGGGIALTAPAPLAPGAHLAIDLVLLPSSRALRAIGMVIDCLGGAGTGYEIRVEFTDIDEHDRDLLIQHIVRRQAAVLREAGPCAYDGATTPA